MYANKVMLGILLLLFTGCNNSISNKGKDNTLGKTEQRPYLLERVEDVAVVQLYADGFDKLALRERILTYYLYQAALAGRDIFIDQKYAPSLTLRDLLEEVITHWEGIETDTLDAIRRYTKLFWINNGPHNTITGRKNVLTCTPQALEKALVQAEVNGATLPTLAGESVADCVNRFKGILFDSTLRDEVIKRWDTLGQPSYKGFVMPELTAHRDTNGEIQDVTVSYPQDLETQMLKWSGQRCI